MACGRCGEEGHNKRTCPPEVSHVGVDLLTALQASVDQARFGRVSLPIGGELVVPDIATDTSGPGIASPQVVEGVSADQPVTPQPEDVAPVTEPGIYQLTAEQYLADPVPGGSLSNSGAKLLMPPGAPAKYRYALDNKVTRTSAAFDLGHAVHRIVLDAGNDIAVRPEEFDSYKTKAAKEWLAETRAANLIPATPEEYAKAHAMARALLADKWAGRLLAQPGKPEQAMVWQDATTGAWRRSLVDYLPERPAQGKAMLVSDVKTTIHGYPDDDMARDIYRYGYHRQGATVMDGVLALGLAEAVRFFLLYVETDAPHLVTVVELDALAQMIGRYENRLALEVFAECQRTGNWWGYPTKIGDDALPLPRYIESRFEGIL